MITLRRADERGRTKLEWLDSRHTFSFADYYDPQHMGFRTLRVINEDRVRPAGGFQTHGHADMEIVSYVLEGSLAHRDSTGTGSVIRPGEIQRMSAGSGIRHSEMNPSHTEPVHFLQMWVLPERRGLPPSYEQRAMPAVTAAAQVDLIGSRDGRNGSVLIHQDVDVYRASVSDGAVLSVPLAHDRHAWVQVVRGTIRIDGAEASAGDGVSVSGEQALAFSGGPSAEVIIFDLA